MSVDSLSRGIALKGVAGSEIIIPTNPNDAAASANTAAINAALAYGGRFRINGTVPINGPLVNNGAGPRAYLSGAGWGSTLYQTFGGTVLKWVGIANDPMYVHQTDFGGGISNLRFMGQTAAPPLCAILLDTGKYNAATNSYSNPSENRNCTEGTFDNLWIGQFYGLDTDATNTQFPTAILASGTINGDTHRFGLVFIAGVSGTAIIINNWNAAGLVFDTLLVKAAQNCIDTSAGIIVRNFYGTSVDYNFLLRDNALISIDSMFTENGGGLAKFLAGPTSPYTNNIEQRLIIRSGGFQQVNTGHVPPNTPYAIDTNDAKQWTIILDNFQFQTPYADAQAPLLKLAHSDGNVYGFFKGNIQYSPGGLSIRDNIITGPVAKSVYPGLWLDYQIGGIPTPAKSGGLLDGFRSSANSSTAAATILVPGDIIGGSHEHALHLNGAIAAASIATLPSVSSLAKANLSLLPGQTYKLRVINDGGGAGTWTISNAVQAGSALSLVAGGSPAWDATDAGRFGSQVLNGGGYGHLASFPAWPGTSGAVQARIKRATLPGAIEWILGVGGFSLTVSTAGLAVIGFTNQDGVGNGFTGVQQVCDGAWHLVELNFTVNGTRVFVDGARDMSLTLSAYPQPNSGGDIAIGARPILFTSGFGGKIDEVSFWNGNLHFNEDSYTPPAVPWSGSEANILALYHLDGDFTSSVATGGTGGWTLSGPMTIPPGTFRDFYVTFNSLTTATLQSVGAGDA